MCNLHDDIDSQLQGITGSNSSFLLGHIYMIMWSNGNTLSIAGPVWGESTTHQRFPSQRASDVDLLSFLLLGWTSCWKTMELPVIWDTIPDSKVHGANMGPTWALSAPDGPHELCYQGWCPCDITAMLRTVQPGFQWKLFGDIDESSSHLLENYT